MGQRVAAGFGLSPGTNGSSTLHIRRERSLWGSTGKTPSGRVSVRRGFRTRLLFDSNVRCRPHNRNALRISRIYYSILNNCDVSSVCESSRLYLHEQSLFSFSTIGGRLVLGRCTRCLLITSWLCQRQRHASSGCGSSSSNGMTETHPKELIHPAAQAPLDPHPGESSMLTRSQ